MQVVICQKIINAHTHTHADLIKVCSSSVEHRSGRVFCLCLVIIHSACKIRGICHPLSAAAILHIHLVTAGSRTSSVGYMRTDIFQWLLPPPNPPPSSSGGPSAPALSHYVGETFGGLSVLACRTVSKHNVSQWAPSQFVSVCVCG